MRKPLILISSCREMGELSVQRRQSELYGVCLEAAGAAGVLYTRGSASGLAARCDGLLLSGGGDVHPARYGQAQQEGLSIDTIRDAEEQALFESFCRWGRPVLGICRGIQLINVLLGGTLHQHVENHQSGCHAIACTGPLAALIGPNQMVNSYHHQAIDQTAPSLVTAARAPDGCIEAVYLPNQPVLGVQWHPERMVPPFCNDMEQENHLALFQWLVERC